MPRHCICRPTRCAVGVTAWRIANWISTGGRIFIPPPARPLVISTNGATSENSLTAQTDDTATARGRRFFTDVQKLAIVQESEAACAAVSAVARRHGIATGILFRWRADSA